jgi:hypothetical protein
MTEPTRIGVLCVHGVGDQRPGAFVEELAEALLSALRRDDPARSRVWEIADRNPAVIKISIGPKAKGGRPVELFLHEVHWADLDDSPSAIGSLRFWWWGFSQWSRYAPPKFVLKGAQESMITSGAPEAVGFFDRLKLFGAATIVCAAALLIRVLTRALDFVPVIGPGFRWLLGRFRPAATIVEYAGDVKLYVSDAQSRDPLERRHAYPRVAIRRRMIRAMVDVAQSGYERWYVLAHSLGSVVAFNALMETEAALPNYLGAAACARLRQEPYGWLHLKDGSHPPEMMPPRPPHVRQDEVLCRRRLFEKLAGFMTYGSPLDKFYSMWRPIVPINKDLDVLGERFQWINAYEDLDPIGACLNFVESEAIAAKSRLVPQNYRASTCRWLGIAHIAYFRRLAFLRRQKEPTELCVHTARWLVDGEQFAAAAGSGLTRCESQPAQWPVYSQAVAASLLMALIAGAAFYASPFGSLGSLEPPQAILIAAFAYLVLCGLLVLIVGAADWSLRRAQRALTARLARFASRSPQAGSESLQVSG